MRAAAAWSAPSAIGTGSFGAGLQIGAELTDFVIILNNERAVKAFMMGGNVALGGNLSVAAGPIGRTAEGSAMATLARRHARLNLLNLEAVAAACWADATVWLSPESASGVLPDVLDAESVRWRVVDVRRSPR